MNPNEPENVLKLEGISKSYPLNQQHPFILKEAVKRILFIQKKRGKNRFLAIDDLSLAINKGESVGIIGSNGAGKSTLLSLITGSVFPTSGKVSVTGRIGALLELGAGFHPDLTGRENVFLNASLLGLTNREIKEKFNEILEFSELHDFIDMQIRNYSSGMHVRLGFSVAIHINPEIILIDEALAVGDHHFQQKCINRILSLHEQGKTLLFVSHSLDLVAQLCKRIVWLKNGHIEMDGDPGKVIAAYSEFASNC